MRKESSPGVVVIGRFPPPMDGQAIATSQCAHALSAGFDVMRLDTNPPGRDPVSAHPRFSFRRTFHFMRLRRTLSDAIRRAPGVPVLWHSISPAPLGHLRDVLATLPAIDSGRPLAAVLHRAGIENLFQSPIWAHSANRLLDRVDLFVFQSFTLAERAAPHVPPRSARVIPNTVSDEFDFSEADLERRWADPPSHRPARLLFLSNMMREKGFADVLTGAHLLHDAGFSFHLDLVGRWPSQEESIAAQAQVDHHKLPVTIHGGVSPREARALHLDADVFLLPTYHPTETQPIAILEALASGTPVISVDRDIIRDMVTDGSEGVLVPARDGQAIANAVRKIVSDPGEWRSRGQSARARFDKAFSPAAVRAKWCGLVEELHQLER